MNCKITENYFAEKARMTTINDNDICGIVCEANKAIAIIQKWSDEHPIKEVIK